MGHLFDRRRPAGFAAVPPILERVVRDVVSHNPWPQFRDERRRRFPLFVRMGEAWLFPDGVEVGLPFLLIPTGSEWGPLTPDFDLPGVRPRLCMWLTFSEPALRLSRREQIVAHIEAYVEGLLRDAQPYFYSKLWC